VTHNKTIIFTDLDGTLLDEKYSFKDINPLIKKIIQLNVKIVLCSSKTRLEIEHYQKKLGIIDPFISENGAAIFIPKGYFKSNCSIKKNRNYDIIELGTPYSIIRKKLEWIRKKSACDIVGFGDMTTKDIAKECGLPLELAKLAKEREYSEPFVPVHNCDKVLFDLIEKEGLRCIKGGHFYHLTGSHDKGKAVALLKKNYISEFGVLKTLGLGNAQNDFPMLNVVDCPFFVKENQKLVDVWARVVEEINNC
jgi:mannosyl-3-phosphoglycerate phosphatase